MEEFRPSYQTEETQRQVAETAPLVYAEKKSRGNLLIWISIAVILITFLIGIVVVQAVFMGRGGRVPELAVAPPTIPVVAPSPTELSNSFRQIARMVKPAVVNINVVERAAQSGLSDFNPFGSQGSGRKQRGTGSGFIVTNDGYILTNNHVVGNAEDIRVTLSDGREAKAHLIGTDPETDIAVIKIDQTSLPTVTLGNSDDVEQGDWVLALGSPFGLQQTLTAGIVSATGRELRDAPQYSKFIQTDASINPGNSGGPLIDMKGQVIGINTMIATRSGASEGVGFSIAANIVRGVFDELIRNGKVTRGYLGVAPGDIDGPKARALGLDPNSGALLIQVTPGTPAAKAGLRSGDVVTAIDGKHVSGARQLTDTVAAIPVGKSVRIDYLRDGHNQSVTAELAERPSSLRTGATEPEPETSDAEPTQTTGLGISAQNVGAAAAQRLLIKNGAVVVSVQPGSPAAEAGIRHGDIIHRVDRTEVKTADELGKAIRAVESGAEIAIQIERNGQLGFLNVTIP